MDGVPPAEVKDEMIARQQWLSSSVRNATGAPSYRFAGIASTHWQYGL